MFIKTIFFLSLLFVKNNFNYRAFDSGFIEIGYWGDSDKPYNKIIFHLSGSITDTSSHDVFVSFFEVKSNEFSCIKNIIESCKFEGQASIPKGQYYFMIRHNRDEKTFSTLYLEPIKYIFQKICFIVTDPIIRKRVKEVFNETLWRLGYKSELK